MTKKITRFPGARRAAPEPSLSYDEELAQLLAVADAASLTRAAREASREAEDDRFGVPAEPEARRAFARASLLNFMRAYLPHYLSEAFAPFHEDLAAIALDIALCRGEFAGAQGFVAAAPRGHAKSTYISLALPLYCIAFRLKRFIVIISDTDDPQAKNHAANIKAEIEDNERLREDFGDLSGASLGLPWGEQDFTAAHVELGRVAHRTRVLSRGILGKIRGLRQREARPDLLVVDDAENDENVTSDLQRDKIWHVFTRAVTPMVDRERGRIMVVGTVLHEDSLLRRLLDRAAKPNAAWVSRFWTAILPDGQPLWPEAYPLDRLEAIRREDAFVFEAEYMNNPVDEAARVVRPQWIHWYTLDDIDYDPARHRWRYRGQPLSIIAFCDPAISERDSADEFALVVLGLTADRQTILVIDVAAGRIDTFAQEELCVEKVQTYGARALGIEDVAYQKALAQRVRRRLRSEAKARPVPRRGRKGDRIRGMSPLFAEGMIRLRAALPDEDGEPDTLGLVRVHHSQQAFYRQLIMYPRSAHDDMIDALEGGVRLAGVTPGFLGYRARAGDDATERAGVSV